MVFTTWWETFMSGARIGITHVATVIRPWLWLIHVDQKSALILMSLVWASVCSAAVRSYAVMSTA